MREFGQYLRLSVKPSTYPIWYRWVAAGIVLPAYPAIVFLDGFRADIAFAVFCVVAGFGSFFVYRKLGAF